MWQMVGIFWDRFEEVLERERELQAIVRGVGDSLREDNQLGREENKKGKKIEIVEMGDSGVLSESWENVWGRKSEPIEKGF